MLSTHNMMAKAIAEWNTVCMHEQANGAKVDDFYGTLRVLAAAQE